VAIAIAALRRPQSRSDRAIALSISGAYRTAARKRQVRGADVGDARGCGLDAVANALVDT
jgi:hypothetical protein